MLRSAEGLWEGLTAGRELRNHSKRRYNITDVPSGDLPMKSPDKSVFSTLSKWTSARSENYLTESLTVVLNSLLSRERTLGVQLLGKICGDDSFSFDALTDNIVVVTQEISSEGTPDITVSCPGKMVYIEVKDRSRVDVDQLNRYKHALISSGTESRRLVLLTRHSVDSTQHQNIPDKHIRWFEINDWLADVRAKDPVDVYLVESFRTFLRENGMTIEKVSWEYINGVAALNNLIAMVEVAIKKLSLAPAWGTAKDYRGFYFRDAQFWCGILYEEPKELVLSCERIKFNKATADKLAVGKTYCVTESQAGKTRFVLDLETKHFFSLSKQEQLDEVAAFIGKCYADAQKMAEKP